ncbi:hypothetical protein [Qipengyuania qiaonensis]|uniref:DUF4398 domain-containing protein n=1 Tax=Qipengyuania qiaonensis TaxID=2867240 RepID=A0ABS7JAJ4_9SPHN|nr:hypothetical protein [Qipengyuania qiaonensis]MBX7483064.1 hypothetical protein [Qipengyuania qiaonensis]
MIDRKHIALPLVVILLAGCAGASSGRYPSLAVRDVERAEGTFEPVPGPQIEVPQIEMDGGTDTESGLAALVEEARKAHAAFTEVVPTAERRVQAASGNSIGSDSWAAAQIALADLDSARSNAAIVLGELDTLYTATAVQGEDASAIAAARDTVIALVSEEDTVLERLRAQVR